MKGGPLFFSWFVFYLSGGRLVLRHIGVFGSLSCVPVCFSLSFVFLPSEARRLFFLECGRWDSLGSGEKKLLSDLFFGLLLFIVVLGTFDPSRVRLFGNIHVVLVLTYMSFYVCRDKKKSVVFEKPLSRKSFFFFWLVGHLTLFFSHRAPQGKVVAPPSASTP